MHVLPPHSPPLALGVVRVEAPVTTIKETASAMATSSRTQRMAVCFEGLSSDNRWVMSQGWHSAETALLLGYRCATWMTSGSGGSTCADVRTVFMKASRGSPSGSTIV